MKNSWFGEWVYFENEKEKKRAFRYLKLWKYYLLKRLEGMQQVGEDQYIIKENKRSTIGLKIEMSGDCPVDVMRLG